MTRLPDRPNLDNLKKQAKHLLARWKSGEPGAMTRFRHALPAASGLDDAEVAALGLRLRDAQSCVAREYGFPSWTDLNAFVAARNALSEDPARAKRNLLNLIYAGDIVGGMMRAQPEAAARVLGERPDIASRDPLLACAIGDTETIAGEIARDPAWIDKPGGPLALPPLIAVTHSSLIRLPAFRERLVKAAAMLLDAGADPNRSVPSRWGATVEAASAETPLSALYGAAGQNRDPELTRLLLERGADPNDGESLYHSLEHIACTRLLLEAGARSAGTNALYRALDLEDAAPLRLLLEYGADPNEPGPGGPADIYRTPLMWAIRRRRSLAHVEALLAAGADPAVKTARGESTYALAMRFGLPDVAERIGEATGGTVALSPVEAFVAACARADEPEARRLLAERPNMIAALPETTMALLPELAAEGAGKAVRVMVRLGWPIAVRGGDWNASPLNHAVFRGDAALARFLLANGAHWTEEHGFDDNVCGTLSWSSMNEPVENGNWKGCAEALLEHGLPPAKPDPNGSDAVVVEGRLMLFSEDVADALLQGNREPERVAPAPGGG